MAVSGEDYVMNVIRTNLGDRMSLEVNMTSWVGEEAGSGVHPKHWETCRWRRGRERDP
jgi:hypothetical protein